MIASRASATRGLATGLCLLWGGAMWAWIALLASRMFASVPPTAGFDLELLLAAGRDVAAGRSPYDPAIVAGAAPAVTSLFYSYPPPVAQATALVAGLPTGPLFAVWSVLAVTGVGAATLALRARLAPEVDAGVAVGAAAGAAVVLPFTIGVLFGNVDGFFPLLYGLLLVGCLSSRPRDQVLGGAALAVAVLAKVHPASLGLWLLVRIVRARREGAAAPVVRTIAGATATVAALVGASLLIGGPLPWGDYLRVVATLGGADLVQPGNVGPATQLALLFGGDSGLVRLVHLPVVLGAIAVTGWAAIARRDVLESLAWAAAASMFILPVTWYHYPAALLPFGIGAMLRAWGTRAAGWVALVLIGACVLAAAGLVWPPLLWLAVALVVAAAWGSGTDR